MSVEVPSKRPRYTQSIQGVQQSLRELTRTDDQENEPPASRAKLDLAPIQDSDSQRRRERERQAALRATENALLGGLDKPKADPKVEMAKLANTVSPPLFASLALRRGQRGGGTYIPPHRLKAMMAEQEAQDAASVEYQRMTWEALRKSINGLINKVRSAGLQTSTSERV
jgi:pre-mRNA-splicing factor CWC22